MSHRLAYRILSAKTMLSPPKAMEAVKDADALQNRHTAFKGVLNAWPILQLDNVAKYYAESSRAVWKGSDIPNWVAPFSSFFVEWEEPQRWDMGNGLEYRPDAAGCLAGAYVLQMDLSKIKEKENRAGAVSVTVGAIMGSPNIGVDLDHLAEQIAASRWVTVLDFWMSAGRPPISGRPLWMGVQCVVFSDESGHYVGRCFGGVGFESELIDAYTSALYIAGLAFSFCHCKNVTQREVVQTSDRAAVRSHGAPEKVTYRVLNIDPMKEVLRSEGGSRESGAQKALHICRGHFASYSEEKPLFGKIAGTFWIPDHTRGSAECGQVIKDYALKTEVRNGVS